MSASANRKIRTHTARVRGYHIEVGDGDIGHVDDFVIDDESLGSPHIVVDTRKLVAGEKSARVARVDQACGLIQALTLT